MTLAQIKARNSVAGFYFFEPETMRFFRSRVSEITYQASGGVYLVTSERAPRGSRLYTVRFFDASKGSVETVGPFNTYTRGKAHGIASKLAKAGV